ncbi:MAG: hypothetical protein M1819_007293 [Sarea resinae]|nr:MAG: hypothetical protein M1819_007293 [Sarea resinae]
MAQSHTEEQNPPPADGPPPAQQHHANPAYTAAQASAIYGNRAFYHTIASSAAQHRQLLSTHTVPPRSGYAWRVRRGQICRITTTAAGPQVGDLNIWNAHEPRERLWAARTRQLHSAHVSTGDRLWSTLPFLRPLVTITGDSMAKRAERDGERWKVNKLLTGDEYDHHCHSNLVRAIAPHGLTEFDVHDVLNVFQVTGLNEEEKYYMDPSPAQEGDYLEFIAELDILCALSTCPGGDLSHWGWGRLANERMAPDCRPLGVEVYEVTDASLLDGWQGTSVSDYGGGHGV